MMNKLTEQLKNLLTPKAALIAYRTEEYAGNDGYFLELRPISADGVMGAAIPVTYDFMNEIVANFSEAHNGIPAGRIPGNLLFADTRKGSEKYIWSNPPRKRMMYFVPALGIENAEYNLPGIIYIAGESRLEVFAYKDAELSGRTGLFEAPFFNTSGGRVCLGAVKLEKPPNPDWGQLLEYWEKKFWLTEFSHLGSGGNPTQNNLVVVTKAAKDKDFNLDELKPANKKLEDLMK